MKQAGAASFVQVVEDDFTHIPPSRGASGIDERIYKATHVLLDPSCSGSGMRKTIETLLLEHREAAADRQSESAKSDDGNQAQSVEEDEEEDEEESDNDEKTRKDDSSPKAPIIQPKPTDIAEETLRKIQQSVTITQNTLSSSSSSPSSVSRDSVSSRFSSTSPRVMGLSLDQLRLLLHVAQFPNVHVVVYSTCSHFVQEDECVVAAFIQLQAIFHKDRPFRLADATLFVPHITTKISPTRHDGGLPTTLGYLTRPGIPTAGLSSIEANKLIRCVTPDDHTNGFFVARFERASVAEGDNDTKSMDDIDLNSKIEMGDTRKRRRVSNTTSMKQNHSPFSGKKKRY